MAPLNSHRAFACAAKARKEINKRNSPAHERRGVTPRIAATPPSQADRSRQSLNAAKTSCRRAFLFSLDTCMGTELRRNVIIDPGYRGCGSVPDTTSAARDG